MVLFQMEWLHLINTSPNIHKKRIYSSFMEQAPKPTGQKINFILDEFDLFGMGSKQAN